MFPCIDLFSGDLMLFHKNLWNSNYQTRIFNVGDAIIDASIHNEHQMILVDLNCDGIENILRKVRIRI